MNTKSVSRPDLRLFLAGVAVLGLLATLPSTAHAVPVSSWTQYSGSISSDLDTASPILGNGTTESADGQTIYAATPTWILGAVGDSITLSGAVTFTGLASPQADQFRFGLYDVNNQSGATGWLGYFATNSGGGGNPNSRLWERDPGNTTSFGSNGTGSATQRASVSASPANNAFASGAYTFSLTITRSDSGLDLAWSITGTNVTYTVSGTYADTTPQTYTFDRVGFFTGGGLNADQVSFSNIDVTYTSAVPEPSTWAMLAALIVLVSACLLRRHSSRM
ncbi:PEP-CTERM putative exosortase interaction domain-containing protein [Opitutaceae bacterium TAV1]|nr:PEP-CTERM putative exosortase interaction domain-containing protein [Opitutaceae bacterium TAV1]